MKNLIAILIFCILIAPLQIHAENQKENETERVTQEEDKDEKGLAGRFAADHGRIWASPFHWKVKDWLWVGGISALTAVLIHNDEMIYRKIKEFQADNKIVDDLTPFFSTLCQGFPFAMGAAFIAHGLLFKDKKSLTTGSLSMQAMIHSFIVIQMIKHLTGRQRPSWDEGKDAWVGPNGFFERYEAGQWARYDAFASGHTITIWSLATVVAHQYNKTPWIPILSYTVAALSGMATVTDDLHWVSDVLVGAAMGFAIGKFVVRRHRTKWTLSPMIPANGGMGLTLQISL